MRIRDADAGDYSDVERLHGDMGIDYELPNLAHPLFVVQKVAYEDGRLLGACFLRLTAETYLWLDPALGPRAKMETMAALQPEVLAHASALGLDTIEACIPSEVEKRFAKRLIRLGWERCKDKWHQWSRLTRG